MNNIENLIMTFLKPQKICVSKIKLYTPNNVIFETEGQDILKYVILENINIEQMNEQYMVLDVKDNSTIYFKE